MGDTKRQVQTCTPSILYQRHSHNNNNYYHVFKFVNYYFFLFKMFLIILFYLKNLNFIIIIEPVRLGDEGE